MAVPQVTNGQLSGVTCVSTVCEAVGANVNSAGELVTLAEQWNGQAWITQKTPNPITSSNGDELHAVSCVSETECQALGDSQGSVSRQFAEHWNGATWTSEDIPAPAGSSSAVLNAISCVSASFCSAAGSYITGGQTETWIAHWNGGSWAEQLTPHPSGTNSYLYGISCRSTKFCTAVGLARHGSGIQGSALAETWNGSAWTIDTVPLPSGATSGALNDVSCSAASSCEAVGGYTTAKVPSGLLAEKWNGAAWTLQTTAGINGTGSAVSCAAAVACTAIAAEGLGAARFNGTTWTAQTLAAPSGGGIVNDVSCDATKSCTAVGRNGPGTLGGLSAGQQTGNHTLGEPTTLPGQLTLAEQWNGSTWALQSSQNRGGAAGSLAADTSCVPKSSTCEAVGVYNASPAFAPRALAELWNGATWTLQAVPAPPGSALSAVSCSSTSACTAVGQTYSSGAATGLLAERWNGSTWTRQTLPLPPSFARGGLGGVSCPTSNWCTAVGDYGTPDDPVANPLVETWDGSSWSASTPNIGGSTHGSSFSDVSCASPKICGATGNDSNGWVATWNGTQWGGQDVVPPGSVATRLNGVSCPSATACVAIGFNDDNNGIEVLTVPFNLTTSSTQTTSPLSARWDQSVSCVASTSCEASAQLRRTGTAPPGPSRPYPCRPLTPPSPGAWRASRARRR